MFKPNGLLDVSTAATDLPSETFEGSEVSDALARCKNLAVDRKGRVDTRPGSTRSGSALSARPSFILEQSGDRYAFIDQEIYKNESALTTSGLSDGDWSAVSYNAFNETTQSVFALNGTDRKRIDSSGNVREWGITAPAVVATLSAGASTGLTGDYLVKYTYARKDGSTVISESNPSSASASQTLSNQSLDVTWTASGDGQVTHVRIYRTLAGGTVYFHDQDVAVGTTTIDTNTSDAALGGEVATNHDRPPAGTIVAGPFYGGLLFIAKDNLLYWCLAKQPEYYPAASFIEVGPPSQSLRAVIDVGGQIYVLTDAAIWFIQGTGAGTFNPIPLRSLAGAPNQFGALAVEGRGIYHLGTDGLYLFSGGRDSKISQAQLEALFDATAAELNGMSPVRDWPSSTQWLHQFGNQIYLHYGVGNVLVFNLANNRNTYYRYAQQLFAPATDTTNHRFYVGDAGGFVRQIEALTVAQDVASDIAWEVQSKDFTLQTRRHFPRWVKYDVDASAATNVKGEILLDGVVHQTHTITGSRVIKRRLIDTGNGARCAIRISGTGTATVYAAEME
jgi:hypothetical protein